MVVLHENMVKASRRKASCPRKILRVQHDDGRCELQPQENGFRDNQSMGSDDGTIPSPSCSPPREGTTNFYEKYEQMYNNTHVDEYSGEYLKETTKVFLNSLQKTDYVVVQPSYEPPAPALLSDTTNTEPPIRIKTYNGVKKQSSSPLTSKDKHRHPEPTPEYPYQCETCDMLFKSIELLSDHQKTLHENNRQFACRYCSKRFNDKYNMRKHVLIHVGEKRHKCQFCDKAFLRKDHLRSHLQTHYNRKYGCKVCGKSFRTIELYQRHAKSHKNSDHLSEINNLENLQPELDNSMMNGSPIPHAEEPAGNETPVKQEDLRNSSHQGSYEDSYADQSNSPWNRSGSPTFSDISGGSTSHASPRGGEFVHPDENGETNSNVLNFKCSYCNLTCEDKTSLNSHEMKCRSETQKWQCIKCSIVFDEPATLKQHYEKVHSAEKPAQSPSRWRCKTCDINYPNSKELSRHYAHAHKDAQIFPCSECPKTFTVWHNLKKHMLIHLGDKKHKCNVCQKGFVRKDHLNSHMKVHMGDGSKYTCPICRKVFRLKQMYFKHMNLHGLEQAYNEIGEMDSKPIDFQEKTFALNGH